MTLMLDTNVAIHLRVAIQTFRKEFPRRASLSFCP